MKNGGHRCAWLTAGGARKRSRSLMDESKARILDEIRQRNSEEIAERVERSIASLLTQGRTPSFYSVAAAAEIARSTLYRRDDLRELVVRAREGAAGHRGIPEDPQPGCAKELLGENERLRGELARVREELERTRADLRQARDELSALRSKLTRLALNRDALLESVAGNGADSGSDLTVDKAFPPRRGAGRIDYAVLSIERPHAA